MAYFSLIQQLKEQVSLILDNYVVISDEGTEDDNRPAEWPDIKWWGMFQALVCLHTPISRRVDGLPVEQQLLTFFLRSRLV